MKTSGRITLSIDNKYIYKLRKRAADLGISLSALTASYIEGRLCDENTARLNDEFEDLTNQLKAFLADTHKLSSSGMVTGNSSNTSDPVTPEQLRAFMLETLLYLQAFTKTNVGMRGDIAAEVKKHYGDNRVKGL